MRSVQSGRDLQQLARDLQREFGVTKRRAALIARDQNNKATAVFTRTRQLELGMTRAVWMHSHGGKEPRKTHLKMDGRGYDTRRGMWDPAESKYIFPGELINCRCVSKTIVPGVS
jgi:SPP1 gp7 family putative phage head morphogenesis protein